MNSPIYQTTTFLIGGAPLTSNDLGFIRLGKPKRLIAVDGGANHLPNDLSPDVVIGDLDSYKRDRDWDAKPTILHVTNQDTTDLEKAISFCEGVEAPQPLVCLGFIGGRFDQTLTLLHTCLLFQDTKLVFFSGSDVSTSLPLGLTKLSLPIGCRLSLYPLSACEFGQSEGLKYQLNGLLMEQGHMIGTSNLVSETEVTIDLMKGSCLLIVEREHAAQIVEALTNG